VKTGHIEVPAVLLQPPVELVELECCPDGRCPQRSACLLERAVEQLDLLLDERTHRMRPDPVVRVDVLREQARMVFETLRRQREADGTRDVAVEGGETELVVRQPVGVAE